MTTIKNFFGSDSWRKLRDLTLPQENVVGGVCAGLGEVTPLAAWMWRVIFCATAVAWGFGFVAYIILWISIPNEKTD